VNLLVGLGSAWVIGPQVTFIRLAPNERMAQVTASMFAIVIAAEGLGSLGLGALSDLTSPTTAYVVAGLVVLLAAMMGWATRSRRERLGVEVPTGRPGPVPPVDQPWTSSG
jgi:predicted MFS family arabinose efflux permease